MSRTTHFMFDPSITLPHTLVPLALAVHVVWSRIYESGGGGAGEAKERLLNSIASKLAAKGTVYEYGADARARPRAISPNEIEGGVFRGAGKELCFDDGRPTRRHLAIPADDVTAAIDALQREALLGA
jgi:hypothetical protein